MQPGVARNGPNRRRYRRVEAPLSCRPAGVEFIAQILESVDISFGGVRIYSSEEHQVGSVLHLDIFIPDAAPVTVTAQVMWVKTAERVAPARFDVGLAFVEASPDALSTLQVWLGPEEEEPSVEPSAAAGVTALTLDAPVSELRPTTPKPSPVGSMLSAVPVIALHGEPLRASLLDCRAGFLLWLIDGVTPVETLLDLSAMSRQETLSVLEDLLARGIVTLRESASACDGARDAGSSHRGRGPFSWALHAGTKYRSFRESQPTHRPADLRELRTRELLGGRRTRPHVGAGHATTARATDDAPGGALARPRAKRGRARRPRRAGSTKVSTGWGALLLPPGSPRFLFTPP